RSSTPRLRPSSSCATSTCWPPRCAAAAAPTMPSRRRRADGQAARWRRLPMVLLFVLGGLSGMLLWAWSPDLPRDVLIERYGQPPSTFVDVGGTRVHLRDQGKPD